MSPYEVRERDRLAMVLDMLLCLTSSTWFQDDPRPQAQPRVRKQQHHLTGSNKPLWKERAA